MRYRYFGLIFGIALTLGLAGCGGGGAPGSTGSQDTDILINSASVAAESPDFDAAIHLCDDGKPEDGLFREGGTMTINATMIDPNLTVDPFPATVKECTVTYLKANEDPSSPILGSTTFYPVNCTLLDGDSTCDVTVLDISRKNEYWDAVSSGLNLPAEYPTHYVAEFDCTYQGRISDQTGTFHATYDFWLADFDKCTQ
jgi:hypothetical protein